MSEFNIINPNSFTFANNYDDAGGKIQSQNNSSNAENNQSHIIVLN